MASRELQLAVQLCRMSRQKSRPTVVQLGQVTELRAAYDEIAERYPLPNGVTYQPVDAGGVNCEWLSGPNCDENQAIIYFHGGCYATGSVDTHRDLMTRLAIATSVRVLGPNYRLAPMHPFPAAVDDAIATYQWLLSIGFEPGRIAIAGDSAGAGLALALALRALEAGLPIPSAIVCLSPWVDLAVTGGSMESKASLDPIVSRAMLLGWAKLYLGDHDPHTPLASPLYADLRGMPPILIQVGSAEVLLDDATRLADCASAAGVEVTLEIWPEMIHVWHTFAPILAEARQAIIGAGTFVRKRLDISERRTKSKRGEGRWVPPRLE